MVVDLNIENDNDHTPIFCNKHRSLGMLNYKTHGLEGLKEKSSESKKVVTKLKIAPMIEIASPNALV